MGARLRELDGVDLQLAARVLRGQHAQHRVVGVPAHDLARLKREQRGGCGALDAEVLRELGGNKTLAVRALRRRPTRMEYMDLKLSWTLAMRFQIRARLAAPALRSGQVLDGVGLSCASTSDVIATTVQGRRGCQRHLG